MTNTNSTRKTSKPASQKDPKRVAAGKKAAETRRRNAALRAYLASNLVAANENVDGEQNVIEVTRDMLIPIVIVPPPLPQTLVVTEADIVADFNRPVPPPLPNRKGSRLNARAVRMGFANG